MRSVKFTDQASKLKFLATEEQSSLSVAWPKNKNKIPMSDWNPPTLGIFWICEPDSFIYLKKHGENFKEGK